MDQEGYIYCMYNSSIPGVRKCGRSGRTLQVRLSEANKKETWKAPGKYVIEFSKFVSNNVESEKIMHRLLNDVRVDSRKEFFKADPDHIAWAFEQIEGKDYFVSPEAFCFKRPNVVFKRVVINKKMVFI
jgi:hypothetical protein